MTDRDKEAERPRRTIVVFDDDPTGCQTVHGVDVHMVWSADSLARELRSGASLFYVLTNSRSLSGQEAEKLQRRLMKALLAASERAGRDVDIVSRSDSTLRGHYPLEPDVIREELERAGHRVDGELVIPFFKEGGRVTEGDVHYVEEGGVRAPVGESESARDPTFGFVSSDLKAWIEEKTEGRCPASQVVSIPLKALREGSGRAVVDTLAACERGRKVVVNATEYPDLASLVEALDDPSVRDKRFVFRTAASFVKAFGRIADRPLLDAEALGLTDEGDGPASQEHARTRGTGRGGIEPSLAAGGLVVIGSHVGRTTAQLADLVARRQLSVYELAYEVAEGQIQAQVIGLAARVDADLARGASVVLHTERRFRGSDLPRRQALAASAAYSRRLARVVRALSVRPRFVIAKGGITSSDVATEGIAMKRAHVLGQIIPGVPVWRPGPESRLPGTPYIVFPGNVGDEAALTRVFDILTRVNPSGWPGTS